MCYIVVANYFPQSLFLERIMHQNTSMSFIITTHSCIGISSCSYWKNTQPVKMIHIGCIEMRSQIGHHTIVPVAPMSVQSDRLIIIIYRRIPNGVDTFG